MINIQVHRSAIGLYLDKTQSLSSKGKKVDYRFLLKVLKKERLWKIPRYLNLKIALVLICLRLLIQTIISGMQIKGGDIETNPSPT